MRQACVEDDDIERTVLIGQGTRISLLETEIGEIAALLDEAAEGLGGGPAGPAGRATDSGNFFPTGTGWFSIPQLFRYERQQRGRLREHFQLNCDLIGEASPLADAEIIALAIDLMRAFGLGPQDVRVRLSDRRLLTDLLRQRGVPADRLTRAFEFIDKIERLKQDHIREIASPDQFGSATTHDLMEIASIRGWPELEKELSRTPESLRSAAPLREVFRALTNMGLADFLELDLTIVRGLAYYTGIVFELFDAGRTLRAISGGGRYDNLLRELGGVDLPALGFGMGDVVLAELLKDKGLTPVEAGSIDVFLAFISQEDLPHLLALAQQLRDAGIRVEYALSPQAVGKQLKLADARTARLAVVIGPHQRRGAVEHGDRANGVTDIDQCEQDAENLDEPQKLGALTGVLLGPGGERQLHKRHPHHRVEDVEPDQAPRPAAGLCERADRERRRIATEAEAREQRVRMRRFEADLLGEV
jgi:histidyl-tRNA synthetase